MIKPAQNLIEPVVGQQLLNQDGPPEEDRPLKVPAGRSWQLFKQGLLVFERALGPAGPFRILVSRIELCTERQCDCRDVMLRAIGLDLGADISSAGLTSDGLRSLFESNQVMAARIDLDVGVISPDDYQGRTPLSPEWVSYAQSQIDGELLDLLQQRWLEAKRWKPSDSYDIEWPVDGDLGALIGWHEAHPTDRQDWYRVDERLFSAEEFYCLNPDCTCDEATVDFVELFGRDESEFAGSVRVQVPTLKVIKWNAAPTEKQLVHQLWAVFQQRHRAHERLAEHRVRMKEILRVSAPEPVRAIADRVGRNDLCPCGSGKKHKRCCLNAAKPQ